MHSITTGNMQAAESVLFFRRMGKPRKALFLQVILLVASLVLVACGPGRGPGEQSKDAREAGASRLTGDAWPDVLEKGSGTLYALYVPADGFAYTDATGELTGVTVELIRDFAGFVHDVYGVDLEVDFVEETDWRTFYRMVVEGGDGLIGFGNVTITGERRNELVFSPPYMTNIASLITHRDAPKLERLEDLGRVFDGLTALAFEGTLHEARLRRLLDASGPDLEIQMAHTNDEILALTASGNRYFAYIDLYNYHRAAKRGMPLQRHEAGDDPAEQFGYIMPLETSWAGVVEEYFRAGDGLTSSASYREIMEAHLGPELAGLLLEAATAGQSDAAAHTEAGWMEAGRAAGGMSAEPEVASDLPEGFGYVHERIPNAVLDVRYAYADNFLGVPVDGYLEHVVILTHEALEALAGVESALRKQGYGIIVFDGFRPQKAVDHFVRWARDIGDTLTKHKYYPEVDKTMLFELGYIARSSSHSRGSTVDLTLFYLDTEQEVDMGSGFDFFGPVSHHGSDLINREQAANRLVLRRVMLDHGFVPYENEWWHYTLSNEPFPDTSFNFDVK